MKYSTVLLLFTTLVTAVPTPQHEGHGETGLPAGADPLPPGIILEPDLVKGKPGIVTHRYGPYTLQGMAMISNRPVLSVQRPCSGNCFITAIQAGLETPDGRVANVHTGVCGGIVVLNYLQRLTGWFRAGYII